MKYQLTELINKAADNRVIVDLRLNNAPEDYSICRSMAEAKTMAPAGAVLKEFHPHELIMSCEQGAQWPISMGYVKPIPEEG